MPNPTEFKNAMAHLSSAVSVVTTKGPTGRFGLTASAVCSVSDSPPSLLVCINKSSASHAHFIQNKVLAVNVLASENEAISNIFASKIPAEERFSRGEWDQLKTGSPILKDTLVSFDCVVNQVQSVGSHDVFICNIVAIAQNEPAQALVYFDRRYHAVG